MEKRMTYDDVYRIVAEHCNKSLPLFADGWSRFPEGASAIRVADSLDLEADFWERPGFCQDIERAEKIRCAANEIRVRAGLINGRENRCPYIKQ